ncbi:MAG: AraC family transcriptional regulator [Myxococcota bacterium]
MLSEPAPSSLESAVRAVLARDPQLGQAEVARSLGRAPATLARQLREAGTSYRGLRDALRRDRAVHLLARGATVAEVAEALAFSEASAFQRAFKRWTGVTPGSVRG